MNPFRSKFYLLRLSFVRPSRSGDSRCGGEIGIVGDHETIPVIVWLDMKPIQHRDPGDPDPRSTSLRWNAEGRGGSDSVQLCVGLEQRNGKF